MYVNGTWTEAEEAARLATINPATEQVLCYVPLASARDVARAVAAARTAFDSEVLRPLPALTRPSALFVCPSTVYLLACVHQPFVQEEGSWSTCTGADRAKYIRAIADLIEARRENMARLEVLFPTQLTVLSVMQSH